MITPGNIILTTIIAILLVGSKKIRHLGEDLGIAIKNFKEAMSGEKKPSSTDPVQEKEKTE